ncbi:hypothetical protein ACVBEH_03455 [Roseateles sp. GG27B]
MVEQTAITMSVLPLREDEAGITILTLEFPNTVSEELDGSESAAEASLAIELEREIRHERGYLPSSNSKPLAGSHVLIISERRDLLTQIQNSVQHMGLIVDVVGSVDEATQFCLEGLPHAIIFDQSLRGLEFEMLQADLMREVPHFCFIEVLDSQHLTQLSTATADGLARISRAHLMDALPSMLMFELSKGH